MSKYKVGDVVWVKAEICAVDEKSVGLPYGIKRIGNNKINPGFIWVAEDNITDIGAEETWAIAKKLFMGYTDQELNEIFGDGWSCPKLMELSRQEAKAKIEAWEKANEEFQVGDMVQHIDDPELRVLITRKYSDGSYDGMDDTGAAYPGLNREDWKKTGSHYDIESILKKFKEDEANG